MITPPKFPDPYWKIIVNYPIEATSWQERLFTSWCRWCVAHKKGFFSKSGRGFRRRLDRVIIYYALYPYTFTEFIQLDGKKLIQYMRTATPFVWKPYNLYYPHKRPYTLWSAIKHLFNV
jgi:hypothetical protein